MAKATMIDAEPKVRLILTKKEAELVRAWSLKCVDWIEHSLGSEAEAIWDALSGVGVDDITGDVDVCDPDHTEYCNK